MKIRNGVLFLFVILLMVTMSSCYHRGYLPLSQPDQMFFITKTARKKFFPQAMKNLKNCLNAFLLIFGSLEVARSTMLGMMKSYYTRGKMRIIYILFITKRPPLLNPIHIGSSLMIPIKIGKRSISSLVLFLPQIWRARNTTI